MFYNTKFSTKTKKFYNNKKPKESSCKATAKDFYKNQRALKGYTLIELSITLMIISLLMAGVFSMATGSVVNSKTTLTNQRLSTIYKALGTFLAVNKRLPCPASILSSKIQDTNFGVEVRTASGCIGAGVYQSTSSPNLFFGSVPIKALNLSSDFVEDAFGNKFSYFIDQRFAFDYIPAPIANIAVASFGTSPFTNIITIQERQQNDSLTTLSSDAIIAIISHGVNRLGGFDANNSIQNLLSTETDEASNHASSFNNTPSPPTAIFDNAFTATSPSSDIFDDLMLYKTRANFINDFNVTNLIPCPATGVIDGDFVGKNLYYGQYLYAQNACALNNQIIKIIKCGLNGAWQYVVASCP